MYIFMSFLFSIGDIFIVYATVSELHLPPTEHPTLTLQLHNGWLKLYRHMIFHLNFYYGC